MKDKLLEVGDKIVRYDREKLVAIVSIDRVTPTQAITEKGKYHFKFKRLVHFVSISNEYTVDQIGKDTWSSYYWVLLSKENSEKVGKDKRQHIKDIKVSKWVADHYNLSSFTEEEKDKLIETFGL